MKYEKPVMEIMLLQLDMICTAGLSDYGDSSEGSGGGIDLSNPNNVNPNV